jgi:hypothetical protein
VPQDLIELARQKTRFGYRRLGVLLERRGHKVNHKRLYRIYREENLAVRRLKRKHVRRPAAPLSRRSCNWSAHTMLGASHMTVQRVVKGR